MDITLLFKACIKTIKTKNRAFGQATVENDKNRILQSKRSKQEFNFKSREIIQQISRLHDFLSEHQKAYLNFSNHLSELPEMSDAERDKIDLGAQKIINLCSNFIGDLEKEVLINSQNNKQNQRQMFEHQKIVVVLMKDYLKQICRMYSEQKAIRVKCAMETKRLSQIDSSSPKKGLKSFEPNIPANDEYSEVNSLLNEELTAEELQIFEMENNELFNELNSLTDEVKQIESKVIKIAELQEIFTEKVLQQDKDMEFVSSMVVGTTENVKDANDLIRQAIQRNAGLRVWVLFFLLVLSFSLLFLDWYNG